MISCDYGIVIPVRGGSVRLPRKNALPFGPASSLLEWKIEQLLKIVPKERIYVSTEDAEFKRTAHRMKVNIHDRDPRMATEELPFNDIICGIVKDIPHGHIAWCQVTSPLMSPKEYQEAFTCYDVHVIAEGRYDSLIGVNLLKEYLWNDEGPMNYRLDQHTYSQRLPNIYKLTNSIAIRDKAAIMRDRHVLGNRPYKQLLSKLAGIDIDEKEDYEMAVGLYPVYIKKTSV